jgi:hypothetical protein
MQTTLAQNILKGMPLIIGIFLTIFLPVLLHGRTHRIAEKENLIKDENDDKALGYLLNWRDLLIAVPTGLFVLQFAAAGQLTSTCHKLFFIQLPKDVPLSDIALLVVFITPILLLFGWLLAEKLELRQAQIRPIYWFIFFISVIPWYLLSFFFVYSPDCPRV